MTVVYHVTHTSLVPKVKAEGLRHFQTTNWTTGKGARYGKGELFAFEHPADAVRWASKMDWDFNQGTGTGKISILAVNRDAGKWQEDTNDPLSHAGAMGKWLKTDSIIPAKAIQAVTPVTQKLVKALVQGKTINLDGPKKVAGRSSVPKLSSGSSVDDEPRDDRGRWTK